MILTGHCLCGGVRWRWEGAPRPLVACHCEDCRRTSGHHIVSLEVAAAEAEIQAETLRWYASSEKGRRGFCGTCGGNLFWREEGGEMLEIWMGSADAPTGLRLAGHEFAASKSDYYDIADGLPQFARTAPEGFWDPKAEDA